VQQPTAPRRLLPACLNSLSADLYDLFSKVFALKQSKECFRHAFDPLNHVFFETDLPRSLPTPETL
jgi:hypothetical protein